MGKKGRKGAKGKPPTRPIVEQLSTASLQLRDEIDQDGQTMRRYIIHNIDYGGNLTLDEHAMYLTVRRKGCEMLPWRRACSVSSSHEGFCH